MASSWRQPGLVLFIFISGLAPLAHAMSNGRFGGYDGRPLHITVQPLKRDATICPTNYSLCPTSVGGGCCSSGLSCGVSSCYAATTAGPVQCAGSPGYIACGIDEGGGCCPSGYSCAVNGCIAPAGSSYSQDCSTGSYLCPSSLGYGCCHNDFACAVGYCYPTSFSSVPVTITYTTAVSNSITQIITTVIQTAYTGSVAQGLATVAAASSSATKFTASVTATATVTAVAKVDATSDSNGLTTAELGGIIGAAIAVVIVVCVATYLIIRRLNAVARVAKSSPSKKYGSDTKSSTRPRPRGPTESGGYSGLRHIEEMSIDPLMMSDSDTNAAHSTLGLPRPSAIHSTGGEMEPGVSPPIPAPYGSSQAYIGGYQQVPFSDPYSDNSSHHRSQSTESPNRSPGRARSPGSGSIAGYFDIDPALRDQNLRYGREASRPSVQTHARQWSDSSRPSVQTHGRQWSDASDVSQPSQGSEIIELEAGLDGDRRNSQQQAMEGIGFARLSGRRVSVDSRIGSSSSGGLARRDVGAAPGMAQRLEDVQETHLDARDKSVGPPRTPKTTYQSQFHEMGISSMGPSGVELDRLEQQKVMGNLGDVRKVS